MRGQADMYVFGKVLGQGAFGTVRVAHHKITGHKVAIKLYDKSRMKNAAALNRCRKEISIMHKLNNAYSVTLFETFETTKRLHLGTCFAMFCGKVIKS